MPITNPTRTLRALSFLVFSFALVGPSSAQAESRRFNLHLDLAGMYPPGGFASAGFDWQFKVGYALDATFGAGYVQTGSGSVAVLPSPFDPGAGASSGSFFVNGALGVRFRFLDNWKGYLNEPRGDAKGNLFLVPRLGFALTSGGPSATADVQVGYEFSVARPMQLGVFVRPGVGYGAGFIAYVMAGLGFSFEVGAPLPDDDGDRVPNGPDRCPGTPPGTEVDRRGCAVLRQEMILVGITFQFNSADILPSSQDTLQRAAQTLLDNPAARVEVAGHTDNVGEEAYNLRLSESRAQSVASWLIANGVPPGRLVVKGYGSTQPKGPNDSEESRAQNRRIEFRRLAE